MKRLLILATVSVCAFGISYSAIAEQADVETPTEVLHDAVAHYEAQDFKTAEEALIAISEKTEEISVVLEKTEELEVTDLEAIHEATYTLESAIDTVRAQEGADTTKIDALDEAIQAIHYASENHEEAKVRTWFAKLEPAAGDLQEEAVADAAPVKQEFYEIIIKDHKFSPEEIIVPADEKIKLIIKNEDPTPEEFESHDMNREKIIGGNRKATIFVGPLKPGKYHFFGEFNMDTANGYIIAK